jgi:Carboxypeptidase regulatory-like domain
MTIQVRSSGGAAERRRIAVVCAAVWLCTFVCFFSEVSVARAFAQSKPSEGTTERFRFQVIDSGNDLPVPGAEVSLAYLQKKGTNEVRKEIEVKTDKNGMAEFPRLEAYKLTVSVTAKGYRSYWRWIRTDAGSNPSRIRLERWAKSHK